MSDRELDVATAVIHGDSAIDDGADIAPPLHLTTTYAKEAGEQVYRRDDHRTTERLEAIMGRLDGGSAVAYPSGMAAVAAATRAINPPRIALPDDVYHGTRDFMGAGVEAGHWELVEFSELGDGDVWWVETPSNPKCLITDIAAVAADAHRVGARVVVDATFSTPILSRPLVLGADVVVHASTKFINGHSDAMGGIVVTADAQLYEKLRSNRKADGSMPGSLEVWLTLRGIRTLPLRIKRQSSSALLIAQHLDDLLDVVWYPFLPGHPNHDVATAQMTAGGGVLSFELADFDTAARAVARFEIFRNATSLGGVESLVEHRRTVDDFTPEGLIRLSIGLEDPADLIADLGTALE